MRAKIWNSIGVIGGVLTAISVLWEYVRMKPDTTYLVDPWALRGFEFVHGGVAAVIGVLLAGFGAAAMWRGSMESPARYGIVAGMVVAAAAVAGIFAPDTLVTFNFIQILGLAIVLGLIVSRLAMTLLGSTNRFFRSSSGKFVTFVGTFFVVFLLGQAALIDKSVDTAAFLGVGFVFVLLATLALSTDPVELAVPRMLMYSTVVAGAAIGLSAGAMRTTLLRVQSELNALPGRFQDTQITWGYLMANIGVVLAFLGAAALWGRRRDQINTAKRIAAQRAAAERSAAEIQAAREAAGLS